MALRVKPRTVQIYDGRWQTLSADYWHECCACGLVHGVKTKFDGTRMWQKWTVSQYQTRKAKKARIAEK